MDLNEDNVNTLNMYAVASSNTTTTGTGNYLEFGKYLEEGSVPTGISPTVIPVGDNVDVAISVSRNAGDTNTVSYRKIGSGTGPTSFNFGPDSGNGAGTFSVEKGTKYQMSGKSYSGGRGLNSRIRGQQIQFDDVGDNDYNDLIVSFSDNVSITNNGEVWTVTDD